MANYPTLTELYPSSLKEATEDPVIKSDMEAGYVHTRVRYTRFRHQFEISYKNLPNADKLTLDTFCDTVYGSVTSFTWVHPITSVSYTVRFDKRPQFEAQEYDGASYRWNVDFTLVEV